MVDYLFILLGALADCVTKYYSTRKLLPLLRNNRMRNQGSVRTNDGMTKALLLVGKSMTKNNRELHNQCSIIEIHSLNRTVQ